MKVSAIVEIAMQCFENFGGKMPQIPPPRLRAWIEQQVTIILPPRKF